jgi:hypothetical protein
MILSSFKAAIGNGLRKAHRSVGEPFAIFEEKPKRTCKRPPYMKMWKAEKQRADALEESLLALQGEIAIYEMRRRTHDEAQRELAQKEAENGPKA